MATLKQTLMVTYLKTVLLTARLSKEPKWGANSYQDFCEILDAAYRQKLITFKQKVDFDYQAALI